MYKLTDSSDRSHSVPGEYEAPALLEERCEILGGLRLTYIVLFIHVYVLTVLTVASQHGVMNNSDTHHSMFHKPKA